MRYMDLHCDTLMKAYEQGCREIGVFPAASVDVDRLSRGGAGAQFFAAFVPPRQHADWWERYGSRLLEETAEQEQSGENLFAREDAYIRALRKILEETLDVHSGKMFFAQNAARIDEGRCEGKTAAFFTLEDGRSLGGKLEKLKEYRELGVSLITLTWNYENCLGFPNSREPSVMERGLKPFGREVVEYMNELGMLVDVSHLSDGGFWDVAQISQKPFVASHSNCRALSPHPRNLTDEMLRALAEKGGVAGLNFCSAFLGMDTRSRDSRICDMTAQVCHMVQVGGLECAAIGTDFDGIESRLEIGDPTQMELLFEALHRAGFSQDAVEQIAWKNARRVLQEVLG